MPTFPNPPLPAKNYQSPPVPEVSFFGRTPGEGNKAVPLKILWGSANDGGPNNTVNIDLGYKGPQNFSQIQVLIVDNSACGADVQFVFPDTGFTLTVPAYTPYLIAPVTTGRVNFYVQAPDALATDLTRFIALNYYQAPLAVPVTEEQNTAVAQNIDISTTGTHQLVAAGINGTIENASCFLDLFASSLNPNFSWDIRDGNANILAVGHANANSSTYFIGTCLDLQGVHLRFQNGLILNWTSTNVIVPSSFSANLYYRTP